MKGDKEMFAPEIKIEKFEMVDVITTSTEEEEEFILMPPCMK